MFFTVYASLESWRFTSGAMQDDMSDHPDDHTTLLHPWLKTAAAGHFDSPSSIYSKMHQRAEEALQFPWPYKSTLDPVALPG